LKDTLSDTFTVSVAKNGEVAWQSLQEERPDIVLSDVMMPKMDGLTLLAKIRGDQKLAGLPVVLLTARGGSEEELEGIQALANDYIAKPFNAKVLKARLVNLITMNASSPAAGVEAVALENEDQAFLKQVEDLIRTWDVDTLLQNSDLADALFMTERTLQRKLKDLTGESIGNGATVARAERCHVGLEGG